MCCCECGESAGAEWRPQLWELRSVSSQSFVYASDLLLGIGGEDGAVVVDMVNFQQFSMDNSTWQATIGSGTLLADVTSRLHDAGGRAIAHGTCPQVGIGGHATIGGLGPISRQWGAALDHVLEVEIVLANGTVTRASATQNPDILFVRVSPHCHFLTADGGAGGERSSSIFRNCYRVRVYDPSRAPNCCDLFL